MPLLRSSSLTSLEASEAQCFYSGCEPIEVCDGLRCLKPQLQGLKNVTHRPKLAEFWEDPASSSASWTSTEHPSVKIRLLFFRIVPKPGLSLLVKAVFVFRLRFYSSSRKHSMRRGYIPAICGGDRRACDLQAAPAWHVGDLGRLSAEDGSLALPSFLFGLSVLDQLPKFLSHGQNSL